MLERPTGSSKSLLTGLPACTLQPLHLIQKTTARFGQTATMITSTLWWAFKATKGLAQPYFTSLIEPYKPSCSLRSANAHAMLFYSFMFLFVWLLSFTILLFSKLMLCWEPNNLNLNAGSWLAKLWNALPIADRTEHPTQSQFITVVQYE